MNNKQTLIPKAPQFLRKVYQQKRKKVSSYTISETEKPYSVFCGLKILGFCTIMIKLSLHNTNTRTSLVTLWPCCAATFHSCMELSVFSRWRFNLFYLQISNPDDVRTQKCIIFFFFRKEVDAETLSSLIYKFVPQFGLSLDDTTRSSSIVINYIYIIISQASPSPNLEIFTTNHHFRATQIGYKNLSNSLKT